MNINDLLDFFTACGWPGVFAIVLILGAYWFFVKQEKKTTKTIDSGFDKIAATLAGQNANLAEMIVESNKQTQDNLVSIIRTALDKHDDLKAHTHSESIQQRLNISESINDILWDLMNLYNSQRAVVIEFHNSKENLNGLSFIWYDVQYEKQQKGIASISNTAKNMQAVNILPVIRKISKEKSNTILLNSNDIENLYEQSTVLYDNLKEANIEHIIYSGLYSDENKLIGLVALEYHFGYPFHDDIIDMFDIKAKSTRIAQLLQFNNNLHLSMQ